MTTPGGLPRRTEDRDLSDVTRRTNIGSSATRGLATALANRTQEGVVNRRWGLIDAINTNHTVDLNLGGIIIQNVQFRNSYYPTLNERVEIDVVGTDMVVVGATASDFGSDVHETGDIEETFRLTEKPNTLFLRGQTISRTTYARLWNWVVQQGLDGTVFGVGDGSTTFQLPDLRDKTLVGAGGQYAVGDEFGADTVQLTSSEMPLHSHTGSTGSTGHSHSGSVNDAGNHTHSSDGAGSHGHWMSNPRFLGSAVAHNHAAGPGTVSEGPGGGGSAAGIGTDSAGSHSHGINGNGTHDHSFTTDSDSHTHTVSVGNAGGTTAHENRQPSYAVNYLIWT